MTIVSSGAISINSLVGEYGGSGSHSLSEYYKGGSFVANHSNNSNVPTSGTISLSNFYGQNNTSPVDNTATFTGGSAMTRGVLFGSGNNYGYCDSSASGYGGIAYGDGGSVTDGNLQLGNNTTVRTMTGAVGFVEFDTKGNGFYGFELFFSISNNAIATCQSEIRNKKILINNTQYALVPDVSNATGNSCTWVQSTGNSDTGLMNGTHSHRIRVGSSHSSTGSSTVGSGITSEFQSGFTIKITN